MWGRGREKEGGSSIVLSYQQETGKILLYAPSSGLWSHQSRRWGCYQVPEPRSREGRKLSSKLCFTNSTPKYFWYIPKAPLYLSTIYNCNSLPSKVQWTERTQNSHYFGFFFFFLFGSFSVVKLQQPLESVYTIPSGSLGKVSPSVLDLELLRIAPRLCSCFPCTFLCLCTLRASPVDSTAPRKGHFPVPSPSWFSLCPECSSQDSAQECVGTTSLAWSCVVSLKFTRLAHFLEWLTGEDTRML